MFSKKNLKIAIILLSIVSFFIKNSLAIENKILFKVENEIITSIDIFEEIKFLKSFYPEMKNLSKTELFEISKNSVLKEKIKKNRDNEFCKRSKR